MTDRFFDDVELDDITRDEDGEPSATAPTKRRRRSASHSSPYRRLTNSQKWSYGVVSALLVATIALNSISLWARSAGKNKFDDIADKANVSTAAIQAGKKLESACFQCVLGTQSHEDGSITPADTYTTIIKAKMELDENAAKLVHFPDGIQIPGVIFGKTLPGFSEAPNTPVIFTRGLLHANALNGGMALQGNAGYTSLAHIFASQTPVSERCKALLSGPDPASVQVDKTLDRTPHYVLVDDTGSTPVFYYCTCTYNIDSAITSPADGEYCTQFDTTLV